MATLNEMLNSRMTPLPGYAGGGLVGQPSSPQMVEQQIAQFEQQHPDQVAKVRAVVQAALQSGQITPQWLNEVERLAMTALQNPRIYPHVRQLAIRQGLAQEADLSPQFDEGLLIVLIIVARSVKQQPQAAPQAGGPALTPPMQQTPIAQGVQQFANGGLVVGGGAEKRDSIFAKLSPGEYVIPTEVVRAKGTEFFDKLRESYGGSGTKIQR